MSGPYPEYMLFDLNWTGIDIRPTSHLAILLSITEQFKMEEVFSVDQKDKQYDDL